MRHQKLIAPALILLLVGAVYLRVKDFSFLNWDDNIVLTDNLRVQPQSFADWVTMFNPWDVIQKQVESYLPVRDLSYAIDFAVAGLSPSYFHLSNLAYHLANTLLLWFFLGLLVPGRVLLRSFAVLFWALHPTNVETVAWVTGRKDLTATMFVLCTFIALTLAMKDRLPKRSALFLVLFFYLLALGSKHTALTLPLVALCLPFASGRDHDHSDPPNPRRMRPFIFTLSALALLALAFHLWIQQQSGSALHATGVLEGSLGRHYLLSTQLPARYLQLIIAPFDLNVRYAPLFYPTLSFSSAFFLLSCLLILAALGWAFRKFPATRFGLAWFVGFMLLTSNLIPIPNFMADRYLYLPLLGISILILQTAPRLSPPLSRQPWLVVAALAYLLSLAIQTSVRLPTWRSDLTLWKANVTAQTSVPFAWSNLGMAYLGHNECNRALQGFRRALSLDPRDPLGLRGRVLALRCLKRYDELNPAIQAMLEKTLPPNRAAALGTAAVVSAEAGSSAQAEKLFKQARALQPHNPKWIFNLAIHAANQAKWEEARDWLAEGRARFPNYAGWDELERPIQAQQPH